MNRSPIVAGQFYPGQPAALAGLVAKYLGAAVKKDAEPTILAMVPHAGYPYSGPVCGAVLAQANLADRILLLGPNHTGRGARLSLWPDGAWNIPGGAVPVDERTASALLAAEPALTPDRDAHLGEHSLEVILPFLRALNPDVSIIPLCVSEHNPQRLLGAAENMADVLAGLDHPVSIVVSSDMSHYVSREEAETLDALALERVEALDPEGLYRTVRQNGVTMCGVLPMTLGLAMANRLGASKARIAAYATSGDATGDYRQVVGYAGAIVS